MGNVRSGDVRRCRAAKLGQQVLVEMPARNARMPDSQADDLVLVPLLAQLAKRAAVALRGAAHGQGVQLLIEQYARLPCLYARLGERHIGVVPQGQPMLAAAEVATQRPGGAVAAPLAQVQPIAIAEQHRLA